MNYESTRKTVLDAIKEAVEQKLINGTSGNIAMRAPENPNIVCITPSGISYTGMTPEDIAVVEMKADRGQLQAVFRASDAYGCNARQKGCKCNGTYAQHVRYDLCNGRESGTCSDYTAAV